jgi:membrane associated rhomboid family serine protease
MLGYSPLQRRAARRMSRGIGLSITSGGNATPGLRDAEAMIAEARKALWVMVSFLAILWIVQIFNAIASYQLSFDYGLRARDVGSLPEIFSSPFLHFSWGHIESNSGPLFIFGFLAAYRGVKKFLAVTVLIILVSGLGAWFVEPVNTVGAGASGVVLGYFGYVIVRGLFDRHLIDIVIGFVMALCFAYQFAALLPGQAGIGWEAHLFGFAGGVVGGWTFRDRRPKPAADTTKSLPDLTTQLGNPHFR